MVLHSGKLERRSPASLKYPVHEHPVFAEAPQVEVSAASAVLTRREDLEVPTGDEARVAHAHVHRALRRVAADGHRALLHQVLKFSALKPGHCRPRRPRHLFFLGNKSFDVDLKWRGFSLGWSCWLLWWVYKFGKNLAWGQSNRRMDIKPEERASAGTAAPTHRRNREKEDRIKRNQTNNEGWANSDRQRGGPIRF